MTTGKRIAPNRGGEYRNDGVDIEKCTDSISNGFAVGYTESGEWMQYTVDVTRSGTYNISLRTAAKDSAGRVQLIINNKPGATFGLPVTGDPQKWATTVVKKVYLNKGTNRIRIKILNGGSNINYLLLKLIN